MLKSQLYYPSFKKYSIHKLNIIVNEYHKEITLAVMIITN